MTSITASATALGSDRPYAASNWEASLAKEHPTTILKSPTPCWTCRRRRVVCDKALPTCQKCANAGRPCLGYKKPLVWNNGIASRGKMMGRTFEDVETQRRVVPLSGSRARLRTRTLQNLNECTILNPSTSEPLLSRTSSIQGALVDPVFNNLKPLHRFYLDFYVKKLSGEAILLDSPDQNPYRGLISLVGTSPLLLKSILAVSARDFTNFSTHSNTSLNWSLSSSASASLIKDANSQMQSASKYHALSYKQIALAQLRKDITVASGLDEDVMFASISLLMFNEVLESGKDTWKVHLDGAKQLRRIGKTMSAYKKSLPVNDASQSLAHSFFFDACIINDIMGNTLTRPYKISNPVPPTTEMYNIIHWAEKTTFVGCPADLLYLILVVNWQYWSAMQNPGMVRPRAPDLSLTTDAVTVLDAIQAFSPERWAKATALIPLKPFDIPQRTHLAAAYKATVLIYTLRTLFSVSDPIFRSFPITQLATDAITNLEAILIDGPFLKCILWPTFIAGAETIDFQLRERVMQLFYRFWVGYRTENAVNAVKVLKQIWKRADVSGDENEIVGWCKYLADGGIDWLFV